MGIFLLLIVAYVLSQKKTFFWPLSSFTQKLIRVILVSKSTLLGGILILLVFFLSHQSWAFFQKVSVWDFLLGTTWDPPVFDDVKDISKFLGLIPLILGTLLITLIATVVAAPLGLAMALYMAHYANKKTYGTLKVLMEILAGIPSVVYGFFSIYLVAPLFQTFAHTLGITITSESALVAGTVLGFMVVPFMASLGDEALRSIPKALIHQAQALGSTSQEILLKIQMPAALPGLLSALLMGLSRAIGETMLVVMAAGLMAKMTFNPLDSVTTLTVQIVTLMTGDQDFESTKTLSAFALSLVLFFITLILNSIMLGISNWHQKKYGTF